MTDPGPYLFMPAIKTGKAHDVMRRAGEFDRVTPPASEIETRRTDPRPFFGTSCGNGSFIQSARTDGVI